MPHNNLQETDAEKALNLLIHDLRAPLGVAQGYLRLLKDQRLADETQRERVLAQTMDALSRIARLCTDATAFTTPPPAEPASSREAAPLFVERVRAAYMASGGRPVSFDVVEDQLTGSVRAARLDVLADAVATVIGAANKAPKDWPPRVLVAGDAASVRFLFGGDADHFAALSGADDPFDPWRGGHGLVLPLACRTIAHAHGRTWTAAVVRGTVGIALPQESRS